MMSDQNRPRPVIMDYYVADMIADALPRRSSRTAHSRLTLWRWLHRLSQRLRHAAR